MIAKGSIRFILPNIAAGVVFWAFLPILAIFFFSFGFYLIWFFRDPVRDIDLNENDIKSAADGKIIFVEEFDGSIKIGVRMSPFDVHLNRSPIGAQVTEIKHRPGKHLSVYFGDVEKKNEQNLIRMENEDFYMEILQITGIFARRLETWIKISEWVEQGQKIGIIRFGSQTNIFIRSKKANKRIRLGVNIGEKVKAGHSVLATIEDL